MLRKSTHRRLFLVEELEARELFAADISVVNGDLIVQGTSSGDIALVDLGDGTIQATQKGAAADGSDLVNTLTGVVDDIFIRLGNAKSTSNDTVTLDLSKNSVKVDQVYVALGGGTNSFSLLGGTVQGSLQYRGGSGDDSVLIAETASVNGRVAASLGDGINRFELQGKIGKSLLVSGGADEDTVELAVGAVVDGPVSVQLGDGTNELLSSAELGRGLVYNGGSGDDSVALGEESLVDGSVRVRLGDGLNTASVDGVIAGNLSVISSNADDILEVADTADISDKTYLGAGEQFDGRTHNRSTFGGRFAFWLIR